ncbi:MAG: hypothetical protein AB1468_02050 [Candidatus Micrarchaeota archaeon]
MGPEKKILVVCPLQSRYEFMTKVIKEAMPEAEMVRVLKLRDSIPQLESAENPFDIFITENLKGLGKTPWVVMTNRIDDFKLIEKFAVDAGIAFVLDRFDFRLDGMDLKKTIRRLLTKEPHKKENAAIPTSKKLEKNDASNILVVENPGSRTSPALVYSTERIRLPSRSCRIVLLLDDFKTTRERTEKSVKEVDRMCAILTSVSAREGCDTLYHLQRQGTPADLLIATIMPGISDVVRRIREDDPWLRVWILVFNEKDNQIASELRREGADYLFHTNDKLFLSDSAHQAIFKNALRIFFKHKPRNQQNEIGGPGVFSDRRFFVKPRIDGIPSHVSSRFQRQKQILFA